MPNFDYSVVDQMQELLERAVREAHLLEVALDQETSALSNLDTDALNEAVARKHRLATSLEQVTREQGDLLLAGGFARDASGMDACLRAWDQEGIMRPLWDRLQAVMERCRRLNQVNGGVVQTHYRQVTQAIQVLRGEDPRMELYDPHGRTHGGGVSRHISEA